jgi:hypothetical protein
MDTDTCKCKMCDNLFTEGIQQDNYVGYCLQHGELLTNEEVEKVRKCKEFILIGEDNE